MCPRWSRVSRAQLWGCPGILVNSRLPLASGSRSADVSQGTHTVHMFSAGQDWKAEGRKEGEAKAFLLAGRGCCKEEGIREGSLENGWKSDHGEGKEGLPGRGKDVCQRGEAEPCCTLGGPEPFSLAELPAHSLRTRLKNRARPGCGQCGESDRGVWLVLSEMRSH